MAHLRDIECRCEHTHCTSRATVELFNTFNAPLGRYCLKHGKLKLKQRERHEKAVLDRQASQRS